MNVGSFKKYVRNRLSPFLTFIEHKYEHMNINRLNILFIRIKVSNKCQAKTSNNFGLKLNSHVFWNTMIFISSTVIFVYINTTRTTFDFYQAFKQHGYT